MESMGHAPPERILPSEERTLKLMNGHLSDGNSTMESHRTRAYRSNSLHCIHYMHAPFSKIIFQFNVTHHLHVDDKQIYFYFIA